MEVITVLILFALFVLVYNIITRWFGSKKRSRPPRGRTNTVDGADDTSDDGGSGILGGDGGFGDGGGFGGGDGGGGGE